MTTTATSERVSLGPTDIQISPLGIGTWAWGDTLFWQYGKGGYTDADLQAAYQASLAYGINFFDTAEVYGRGRSETLLGQFSREAGWPVVIASKFFPYPWRLRRGDLLNALRGSLQRLGVTRLDLYQVHWPFPPVSIETWMEGMADAVEAGLVRAVGVSNYSVDQMRRAHEALARRGVPLASNQVEYSLLQRKPETSGLLAACRELNVTLIAYSPLAQGLLTGKYTPENPPPGVRGRRYAKALGRVQPLVAVLREIGQAYGKTPAQVALNWAIAKGTVPIPGAKNARQAQDNAGALGWQLTADEVARLDEAAQKATQNA
ncbi:MAG: aldo/keto reductase [Anaerolineae bacterium]|nr:aldo/keto reductase [Anaerolineae bacterium]